MSTPVARRTRSQLRERCSDDGKSVHPSEAPDAAAGPETPDNPEPLIGHTSEALLAEPAPQPTAREIAAAEAARARLQGGAGAQHSGHADSARLPTGPEPVVMDVDYAPASQLQPLGDPSQQCQVMLRDLGSSEWTAVVGALTTARQLVAHHSLLLQPRLSAFMPLLLKSVKNLRSSVCKMALMCSAEAFTVFRGALLPFADQGGMSQPATSLLHQLLLKASADKRFIAEEAQAATAALARSLPSAEALPMLLAYVAHKNPKMRGQAGRALVIASASLGPPEEAAAADTQLLLRAAGTLVSDNTPDARNSARELIAFVQAAFQAAGHVDGKENSAAQATANSPLRSPPAATAGSSPSKLAPATWEAYCRATLSGTAAAAVLRVSSR